MIGIKIAIKNLLLSILLSQANSLLLKSERLLKLPKTEVLALIGINWAGIGKKSITILGLLLRNAPLTRIRLRLRERLGKRLRGCFAEISPKSGKIIEFAPKAA